jgi:subtilisin family serine protease
VVGRVLRRRLEQVRQQAPVRCAGGVELVTTGITARSSPSGSPSRLADVLRLVGLHPLMGRTCGRPEICVGLIDGPVALQHPDLEGIGVRELPGSPSAGCARSDSTACQHGTFVAGVLWGRRNGQAPAICPGCSFVVYPIFAEMDSRFSKPQMPSTAPHEVATAVVGCVDAGARIINLSAAMRAPTPNAERELEQALTYALHRGSIIVAAAGNQGSIGGSAITRHLAVVPVTACDLTGRPLSYANLGGAVGRRGLTGPGQAVTSLGAAGPPMTWSGTSVAAAFVTGAIALLWSVFPKASVEQIKFAITRFPRRGRVTLVPPLLNAEAAYNTMVIGRF